MSELSKYLHGAGRYHTDEQLNKVLQELSDRVGETTMRDNHRNIAAVLVSAGIDPLSVLEGL